MSDRTTAAPSRRRRNVVLTGFMGTGKTTVGRLLAGELGYAFVDTDAVIEQQHGPIDQIFELHGEPAFRRIERSVAADLGALEGHVIATGGGMLLDPENERLLGEHGDIVCLTADPEAIVRRLLSDESGVERPLLAGSDPRSRITALLADRADRYGRFRQVATDDRSPIEVVCCIETVLGSTPSTPSSPA